MGDCHAVSRPELAVVLIDVSGSGVTRRRDLDTGLEPGERPGSVRERAQSEIGRVIEGAAADRPVAGPDVEDYVCVHQARRGWKIVRIIIEDLGADPDCR